MIYFTADLHFGHKNIITFCNRPFAGTQEMNRALIDNWNSRVQKSDEVYLLGDVSFAAAEYTKHMLEQLNGKIYLIKGNHDSDKALKVWGSRFEWIDKL